jgi:hypothetical protein
MIKEYRNFLQFIKARIPELNNLDIQIVEGDQFSMTKVSDYFVIDTINNIDCIIDVFTSMYFENRISTELYITKRNFNNFLALLHEVGHIITRNLTSSNEMEQEYNNFKQSNNNDYESFKTYRELPIEVLADNFAVDFINKYESELIDYFTTK